MEDYSRWVAVALIVVGLIVWRIMPVCQAQPSGTEIPRPEHPRPDFERAEWRNLNGQWQFLFDPDDVGENEEWFGKDADHFTRAMARSTISRGIESSGGDVSTSFFVSATNGSSIATYSGAIKAQPH